MGLFSKFNISTAVKHRSNINLSHAHYTTENFGNLSVPFVCDAVPSDKFHITPSLFARVAPLAVPSYADVKHTLRFFFVPYRVVWSFFNEFITNSPSYNSAGNVIDFQHVPQVSNTALASLVSSFATAQNPIEGSDFVYSQTPYKHTLKSKFVLKVLYSLGYNFNFDESDEIEYNALPLLAYFKVVADYFTPSYIATSSSLKAILEKYRLADQDVQLIQSDMSKLFDLMIPYYRSDYFTSAWENPTSVVQHLPNASMALNSNPDIYDSYNLDTLGTSSLSTSTDDYITQQGLDWLKSLNEYVIRNNYAGSRPLTRLLARFGVHVNETLLNMSSYIGSISNNLTIGEVMSTADSDSLGDYAGRGILAQRDGKTFNFSVSEHGVFIGVSCIESNSHFVEGVRRMLLHKYPQDFFTPEFEDTTLQAIAGRELQGRQPSDDDDWHDIYNSMHLYDSTFGYSARYGEYKFAIDNVTGDYVIPSLNSNIEGFILPRKLFKDMKPVSVPSSYVTDIDATGINVTDIRTQSDAVQYDRIFRDISGLADPFYFVYNFKVIANRPMKSLVNSTLLHDNPLKESSVSINSNDIINS